MGRNQSKVDDKFRQLASPIGYRINFVLLAGGGPCQDLSGLNADPQGLAGSHSSLFFDLPHILGLLRNAFSTPAELLVENVFSMSNESPRLFNQALQLLFGSYLEDAK